MFLLMASIDSGNFRIFYPKYHTWKNNNQIAKKWKLEPLYLGNALWSRQSANVGFLYGSISITIDRSHFGHMNFFVCSYESAVSYGIIHWGVSHISPIQILQNKVCKTTFFPFFFLFYLYLVTALGCTRVMSLAVIRYGRENCWRGGRRECFGWIEVRWRGLFWGIRGFGRCGGEVRGRVRKHVADDEGGVETAMFAWQRE